MNSIKAFFKPVYNTFNIKIGNDERINNKVLTKEDIEKLNNIHIGQRYFNERNVFLFSLYGQGLRVSDALFIKVENFKQSHLEIGMTKTKKIYKFYILTN